MVEHLVKQYDVYNDEVTKSPIKKHFATPEPLITAFLAYYKPFVSIVTCCLVHHFSGHVFFFMALNSIIQNITDIFGMFLHLFCPSS